MPFVQQTEQMRPESPVALIMVRREGRMDFSLLYSGAILVFKNPAADASSTIEGSTRGH